MICTCERGNDEFRQKYTCCFIDNQSVVGLLDPPDNVWGGCGPKGHDHGIATFASQLLRLCSQRRGNRRKSGL